MHERALGRAAAIGAAVLLLSATTALADTVAPSADGVTPAGGGTIDLGIVGPGASITVQVPFVVTCGGAGHVAPEATLTLAPMTPSAPVGGTVVSVGWASVGAAPDTWASCTAGQSYGGGSPSTVVLTAPPSAGSASYIFVYTVSGSGAAGAYAGVTLTLTVVDDMPPVLDLPADMTVEGNSIGGAFVSYAATATDAEDSQAPAVACSPASGAFFPLGSTTVSCSAMDSAGHSASGTFDVVVVDTTAPSLAATPDLTVTTADPGGVSVAYPLPAASDVVDPSPVVACEPASGSVFPVGVTTVDCSATDVSGNRSTGSFRVTVSSVTLRATFGAPIGPSEVVDINPGRTLPVKVALTADGSPTTRGSVELALAACGGGAMGSPLPLRFQEGRWSLGLDTAGLAGCTTATLLVDGTAWGSFTMLAPDAASGSRGVRARGH
jgi:hypothetical protein